MKTLIYLYDKYGEMTIDSLKQIAKKYKATKQQQNALEKTIREITYSKRDVTKEQIDKKEETL